METEGGRREGRRGEVGGEGLGTERNTPEKAEL